ncbi:hypothetical protein BDK51DRAFT_35200 [Blyttiomyces helicus]|uniref:Uncharacterized protein n=1 Tax=Blyttiomyces helicus TaxID=388810 RepID=A0A4P9WFM2_9FUNG|nr:hypothetical protein BDK51DRAFT_35200 [Blyttiomyces helicus]|eukprot:RKO90118.1 hypothetical protein BDK51DRAFT_35200 [Blyttiomyces helicus]
MVTVTGRGHSGRNGVASESSRGQEVSSHDMQEAYEESPDEHSQPRNDSMQDDYLGEDNNQQPMTPHFPQSDNSDQEDACPAQEDDDEATQATLLQQVQPQEASGNRSAWKGRPTDNEDANEDKELWEDERGDDIETRDADPTADRDGSHGDAGSWDDAAFYMAAYAELMNRQLIWDTQNSAPHRYTLMRLPSTLCGLKRLGRGGTRHCLFLGATSRDTQMHAAEDTNIKLPTVWAFATEK